VYEVYVEQFGRDFKIFLKSRSDELALDGVMVLTLIGREKNGEITSYEALGMHGTQRDGQRGKNTTIT